MCPKCGDKVKLKTIFEPPMKDKLASTKIIRKDSKPSGTGSFIVKATEMIVPWPDLEKDGEWCGGAKANFSGLGDNWKNKWEGQKFHFKVSCAGKYGKSKDIALERFPNKKTSPRTVQLTRRRGEDVEFQLTGDDGIVRKVPYYKWKGPAYPADRKYDIELMDDTIILTAKVKWNYITDKNKVDADDIALPTVKPYYKHTLQVNRDRLFLRFIKEFRKSVLSHWNNQLGKYYVHRKQCVRGDKCTCVYGCCKFRVQLRIEVGNYIGVDVVLGKGRANHIRFFTMESRPGMSWRHEVGHWFGLPDEYFAGTHEVGSGGNLFKMDDDESLMGGGLEIRQYYVEFIVKDWIKKIVGEEFEVLERK